MTGVMRKDEPGLASPAAIARRNAAVTEAYEAVEQHRRPGGPPVLLENIFQLDPDADGEIAPGATCPFLGQEASVGRWLFQPVLRPGRPARTLGDFGNVNATSLYAIWESEPYRELQANYYGIPLVPGLQYTLPRCNISGGPARIRYDRSDTER